MDIKEAINRAKEYVSDVFSEESVNDIGLEEVERDTIRNIWKITIGFSRPVRLPSGTTGQVMRGLGLSSKRSYKILSIDDNGDVISMKNRQVEEAQ